MDKPIQDARSRILQRERDIELFISSLSDFLSTNARRILRRITNGDATVQETLSILGSLDTELRALGLPREIESLQFLHADEIMSVRKMYVSAAGKFMLSEVDAHFIEAIAEFDTKQIGSVVDNYLGGLKRSMMSSVFLGDTPDFEELNEVGLGSLAGKARTELNTGLIALNRSITLKKADDLNIEFFEYVGPDDKKTREFCAERVGRVFTRDEISHWDNDQGLPASIYLGGYNCRHQLVAVRDEDARERRAKEKEPVELRRAA